MQQKEIKMNFSDNFLFDKIKKEDFQKMMCCFTPKIENFKKNQIVCDFGKSPGIVGIIREGTAITVRNGINGNRTILESLEEGDIFGEAFTVCDKFSDGVYVVCEEDCQVMFMDYRTILRRCSSGCESHNKLLENFFYMLARRSVMLSRRVELLSRRTIREKILCYLSMESCSQKSNKIRLPMSLSNLADYLCVDRSAMMRELKKLNDENIIKSEKKTITITGHVE